MPTYEYQCSACGHQLESFQKMADPALTDCPSCHSAHLKKLVSAAGFQLKGTGWYVTDFKDKGKKPADNKKTETTAEDGNTNENKKENNKEDKKTEKKDLPLTSTDTAAK